MLGAACCPAAAPCFLCPVVTLPCRFAPSITAGAVELRNSLQSQLGADLPPTLVFDYPSVAALAAYLAEHHALPGTTGVASTAGAVPAGTAGQATLLAELQGIVAGLLGTEVAPDQPLMEAGLDSLGAFRSVGCAVSRAALGRACLALTSACNPAPHPAPLRCRGAAQPAGRALCRRPARHVHLRPPLAGGHCGAARGAGCWACTLWQRGAPSPRRPLNAG